MMMMNRRASVAALWHLLAAKPQRVYGRTSGGTISSRFLGPPGRRRGGQHHKRNHQHYLSVDATDLRNLLLALAASTKRDAIRRRRHGLLPKQQHMILESSPTSSSLSCSLKMVADPATTTTTSQPTRHAAATKLMELEIPAPTREQLQRYFWTCAIPMVGFGFMDQSVMILSGNVIDNSIGVAFGLSTLAAAGLGQVISGAVAALFGGTVDSLFGKVRRRASLSSSDGLTSAQRLLPSVKRTAIVGNFCGVVLGCLLGLINLLFIDTEHAPMLKLQSMADQSEFAFDVEASNTARRDATVVRVKGPDVTGVLASLTTALSENNYNLVEAWAKPEKGNKSGDNAGADRVVHGIINDVLVVQKNGAQVPNEELQELGDLLVKATSHPVSFLKHRAYAAENQELKDRIELLENKLREKQVKIARRSS